MREIYLDRLHHEYNDIAPVAKRFSEVLFREIHQLIIRQDITLAVPIEYRVKSWSSIEEKLGRIRFQGLTLTELNDLIGIRLIILFNRDLQRTCNIIESTFQVLMKKDKINELSYEKFGYQSLHMIIRPPKDWLNVPSFNEFRGLSAEIQIRTLAQHMWAAASHKLQYKQENAVPVPIKRSIHRVSALLETVDLEFERVLSEREKYRSEIKLESQDRKLNADILEALLDSLLPKANKAGFEPYSLLLWELDKIGITTVGQINSLVHKHITKVIEKDRKAAKQYTDSRSDSDERRSSGVYFTHQGLVRNLLQQEYGDYYYSKIWEEAEKDIKK